jgi:hypothetical protein
VSSPIRNKARSEGKRKGRKGRKGRSRRSRRRKSKRKEEGKEEREKSKRRTVRVPLLPSPKIGTSLLEPSCRQEAELALSQRRIGRQVRDISVTTHPDPDPIAS